METWKTIKGFPDYEVSTQGNVRSNTKFSKGKILSPGKTKHGYRHVTLAKNGKTKKFKIARLVAETFIPNPDNLPTVDHIDRDRTNDCVENLRWTTYEEQLNNRRNFVYSKGESHKNSILSEQQVIEIKKLHKEGSGYRKIAKLLNITIPQASSGVKGWKHLDS